MNAVAPPPLHGLSACGTRQATVPLLLVMLLVVASAAAGQSLSITEFQIPAANSQPLDIVSGPDGALWFTTGSGLGRVTITGEFSAFPLFVSPGGLAAGPDANLWFTNFYGAAIGRMTTAGTLTQFPTLSPSSSPQGITAGPDGNLWFCELNAGRVGRVTPTGVISEFATTSSGPQWIAVGPDGNLWITEFQKVAKVTVAGVITEYPTGLNVLGFPLGIAAGPDGNVWFTLYVDNKIGRITPSGIITTFSIPTPGSSPVGIVSGPDGALWFTESFSGKIGRLSLDGTFVEYPLADPLSRPTHITVGPDGKLWFTETEGNAIGRIDGIGLLYYTLPPCRVLDTRGAAGQLGGPALVANQPRSFPFAGACGIPSDAVVVSGNVVAVGPSAVGDFRVYPADHPVPPTTVVSFNAGKTRANNLLVALSQDGTQSVTIQNDSAGPVDVLFDVNGYFR